MEDNVLPPMPDRPDPEETPKRMEFTPLSDDAFEQMRREAVAQRAEQRSEFQTPDGGVRVEEGTSNENDEVVNKQGRIEDILRGLARNIAEELRNG